MVRNNVSSLKSKALKVKVDSAKKIRAVNSDKREKARLLFRGRIVAFRDGCVREGDCFQRKKKIGLGKVTDYSIHTYVVPRIRKRHETCESRLRNYTLINNLRKTADRLVTCFT